MEESKKEKKDIGRKKIAVIIPSKEPKEYIYRALESIKNQTLSKEDYSVTVVLNGDREPYEREILEWIEREEIKNNLNSLENLDNGDKLNSFKIIYSEKLGVSSARNLGIDITDSEFLVFLDDDDYVSEGYLKELLEIAEEKALVSSQVKEIYKGEEREFFSGEFFKSGKNSSFKEFYQCRKLFSTCWRHLIPREVIKEIRFQEGLNNGEDSLFMGEISKNVVKVKTTGENTVYYREIREESAYHRERINWERIKNRGYLLIRYLKLLVEKDYQKKFILSRIVATILGVFKK